MYLGHLIFMALGLNVVIAIPLALPSTVKPSQEEETASISYLKMYGYLSENRANIPRSLQDPMKNALLEFQAFANLNMTGELDQDTLTAMQRPRCGVRDVFHSGTEADREKRYSVWGFKWKKPILTYEITKYTNDLHQSTIDAIIRKAFDMWEAETNLKFERKETSGSNADIIIFFAKRLHGDFSAFDGPGGVLAHAFSPTNGDVHFDDDEQWTHKTIRGTNLLYVAVHEIGHSLGLRHSSESTAIMAPFYRAYDKDLSLDKDDINGIVALYGEKPVETTTSTTTASTTTTSTTTASTTTASTTTASTTTASTTTASTTTASTTTASTTSSATPSLSTSSFTPPINPPQICDDPRIDAITTLSNGTTLIFKGEYYYVVSEENGIAFSTPRNITDLHRSRTLGRIKSAYTSEIGITELHADGGSVYISSTGQILVHARLGGSNLDAYFVRAEDGTHYAMKDSKVCWRKKIWIFLTQPICAPIVDTWKGLPSNIDAAWQRKDGKIYFFKDTDLYRYDDENDRFLEPNPVSLASWMGCPATDSREV